MDPVVLGERVRTLRARKKWTQKELAEAAHVTENTLRGLERGTLRTRMPKIEAIALALGTTADILFQAEAPIDEGHPLLRDLNEEALQIAQAFLRAPTARRLRVQRLLTGQADPGLEFLERMERLSGEDQASLRGALEILEEKFAGTQPSTSSHKPAKKADR